MTEQPPQTPPPLPEPESAPLEPATPPAPGPGDRIGPYRLVRLIGAGAGGSVYEVLHEKLDRPAALKLLAPAQAARPAARARFLAEALAVNRIAHANIVEVTDVVDTPEHAALVMELLEGQSLGAAMVGGPLPPERFLPILAQVCEALAAAHAAGTVHRDLKPENVFLCPRPGGQELVKLLDFGVATGSSVTAGGTARTEGPAVTSPRPATFVGTPAYASPEQAAGGTVGRATDIYAVGVMLYELACGKLPFEGWTAGHFVIQHLSAPVPSLPAERRTTALGRSLDAVVQGCMAKRPGDRFHSAGELAAIFWALARGEDIPVSPGGPRLAPRGIGRAVAVAGLIVVAVLAALGAVVLARRSAPKPAARPAVAPLAPASAPSPAPAFVVIPFASRPAGAEVRRVPGGELLGVTPFRLAVPRGAADADWLVEVSREGWRSVRVPVSIASSRGLSVTLSPQAPKRPPRGAVRHRGWQLGSDRTIDPFRKSKRNGVFWSR